nr:MAG TPA: hypothetical protein [Caudoviricetes sp.]
MSILVVVRVLTGRKSKMNYLFWVFEITKWSFKIKERERSYPV